MGEHGAIVLAGGRSSRMGQPKAGLPWHGSTLLRRVAGLVARSVDGPVVVVRAPGQQLPELPRDVRVVQDDVSGRGPLQGMATGLAALPPDVERAFVCATDLPLLHPAFVRRLTREPGQVVLPLVRGYRQPLAAVWATQLLPTLRALLAAERLRPAFALEQAEVTVLDDAALLADPRLADVDPGLDSVRGVNTPEELALLLDRPLPVVRLERFGVLARAGDAPAEVSAATLGAAATAAGLVLDRHLLAALNGEQTVRDPQTPLAAGDTVAFLSGDAGG